MDDQTTEQTLNPQQQALSIMSVEEKINTTLSDLSKLKEETREVKSSYDDHFNNDAKYRELHEKVQEANKLKTQYKQEMAKQPAIAELGEKLTGMKSEQKDLQEALSDYLREYNRLSGATQFETNDGDILQIVNTFKLVKQK